MNQDETQVPLQPDRPPITAVSFCCTGYPWNRMQENADWVKKGPGPGLKPGPGRAPEGKSYSNSVFTLAQVLRSMATSVS